VLFAGFGALLLLLAALGASAISFLSQLKLREDKIRQDYVNRDLVLEKLRSSIYTSGTHLREFLLDDDDSSAAHHRAEFLETRKEIEAGLAEYEGLVRPDTRPLFDDLKQELAGYSGALAPALNWNTAERRARSYAFLRDDMTPRRLSALTLTDRIQLLNEAQLAENSSAASLMLDSFRTRLLFLLLLSVLSGVGVAGAALWRLLRLESESRLRFAEINRLSAELVSAQESERRRISRELHDEVGQVLSAIVLGLCNLRSALDDDNHAEAERQLQLVEDMTQRNVSVVRNISLLLRPTMLDDLGLIPALKWLAREVSRTGPMMVELTPGSFAEDLPLDDLPEEHRTCVFRIVQEALRNAQRHANATHARISVKAEAGRLRISVEDDGKGFRPAVDAGLGILGMRERVMRLGGTLDLKSEPGRGTVLSFELPVPVTRRPQEIRPLRTA
jgi:signal transduction histidine kinase